jgi:hypothetical protein
MVSDERIAEIRARADAATPGPWGRYGWVVDGEEVSPLQGVLEAALGLSLGSVHHTEPIARFSGYLLPVESNADFSAHARTDVPDLLDALVAARAEIAALRARFRDVDDTLRSAAALHVPQPDGVFRGICQSCAVVYPCAPSKMADRLMRALLAPEPQGSATSGGEG